MELPMNYHKNRNLNTDLLFMKIRIFILSSTEGQHTHLETLFYEYKNYILIISQQIIQLQRFKKAPTVLKGVLKNELINQGVKTADVQYYDTHQESILSNIVTESDIYDNYSYTSFINWEIEKTPKTHFKKLEFNIDKPETGLK